MKKVLCPNCKTDRVYSSQVRGFKEYLAFIFLLKRPFRCHNCYQRFPEHFWYKNWGKPQMQSAWKDR